MIHLESELKWTLPKYNLIFYNLYTKDQFFKTNLRRNKGFELVIIIYNHTFAQ